MHILPMYGLAGFGAHTLQCTSDCTGVVRAPEANFILAIIYMYVHCICSHHEFNHTGSPP